MKKLHFVYPLATLIAFLLCFSCNKKEEVPSSNVDNLSEKGSFTIPEINLDVVVRYEKKDPDNFKVELSRGYTLINGDSRYNDVQAKEYFVLHCRKQGQENVLYVINGIVDTKGIGSTISYNTTNR